MLRKVEKELYVSSSPHLRSGENVSYIMWQVNLALLPSIIAAYIFFGLHALWLILVSVISAVISEAFMQKLFKKPITIYDGSAVLTGILLALCISPNVPWWIPALGSAFAIIVAKQLFGGLGQNIFNPAHAGRAFLLASYPTYMTATWIKSKFAQTVSSVSPDSILAKYSLTSATPLHALKDVYEYASDPSKVEIAKKMLNDLANPHMLWNLFIGNVGGSMGETSAIAILIGAAYLMYKKIISWHTPITYILTVYVLALISEIFSPFHNFLYVPLFHVLSGGLLIGAFFMATDMVTTPVTPKGKIIFGIGAGILVFVIRKFGGYPEGVCYSILIMNAFTPLIDRYCLPKTFGK